MFPIPGEPVVPIYFQPALFPRYCGCRQRQGQDNPAKTYFEATRGVDSYLEMVLPCAIPFHAGQLSAVADLVCQMLGMKIAIRTNNMSRVKKIFTNEIFSDSVVAAHAVRVPVTITLSANTTAPGLFPFTSSISSSRTEVILYSNILPRGFCQNYLLWPTSVPTRE